MKTSNQVSPIIRKIKYLYCGRVSNFNGEVYHKFLKNGKVESFFKRTSGYFIGRTYLGGSDSLPRRPVDSKTQLPVTEEQLDNFNAAEEVVRELITRRRDKVLAERKMKHLSRSKRVDFIRKEIQLVTKGMNSIDKDCFVRAMLRTKR